MNAQSSLMLAQLSKPKRASTTAGPEADVYILSGSKTLSIYQFKKNGLSETWPFGTHHTSRMDTCWDLLNALHSSASVKLGNGYTDFKLSLVQKTDIESMENRSNFIQFLLRLSKLIFGEPEIAEGVFEDVPEAALLTKAVVHHWTRYQFFG